jgi:hypothetical protein
MDRNYPIDNGELARRERALIQSKVLARCVSLIVLLLAGLVCISSCTFPWDNKDNGAGEQLPIIATNQNTLDQQSFVRELVSCLSDPTLIDSVYEAIPSEQLDGLSLSSFREYIAAMTRFQNGSGQIDTFRIIANDEKDTILLNIAQYAQNYKDLVRASIPVELTYVSGTTIQPVYIYYQADQNGTPYLSHLWVDSCLDLYDYAYLYFLALEEQNTSAVASLITRSLDAESGEFSSHIIDYKAKELGKFYHVKVKSKYTEYQMVSYDISQLIYMQPEVINEINFSNQSRLVRFVRNANNEIVIRDNVSAPLSSKNFFLYYRGEKSIRVGDRADSKQFISLFGEPESTALGDIQLLDTNTTPVATSGNGTLLSTSPEPSEPYEPKYARNIVLTYDGASVTIFGNVYDDGTWDGQIIRIRLRQMQADYNLGENIHSGMTREELLLVYPFADQTDYILSTVVDEQRYEMTFTFADDADYTISGVKIELVK